MFSFSAASEPSRDVAMEHQPTMARVCSRFAELNSPTSARMLHSSKYRCILVYMRCQHWRPHVTESSHLYAQAQSCEIRPSARRRPPNQPREESQRCLPPDPAISPTYLPSTVGYGVPWGNDGAVEERQPTSFLGIVQWFGAETESEIAIDISDR